MTKKYNNGFILLAVIFFIASLISPPFTLGEERMTNGDILRLHQLGETDALIITKIARQTKVSFSLASESIASLRSQGVSDAIITAMFQRLGMSDTMAGLSLQSDKKETLSNDYKTSSDGGFSYTGFRVGRMKFSDSELDSVFGKVAIYGIERIQWTENIGWGMSIEYLAKTVSDEDGYSKFSLIPVTVSGLYRFRPTGSKEPTIFPYIGVGAGIYFLKGITLSGQGPGIRTLLGIQWNQSQAHALFSELNWYKTYVKLGDDPEKINVGGPNIVIGLRF